MTVKPASAVRINLPFPLGVDIANRASARGCSRQDYVEWLFRRSLAVATKHDAVLSKEFIIKPPVEWCDEIAPEDTTRARRTTGKPRSWNFSRLDTAVDMLDAGYSHYEIMSYLDPNEEPDPSDDQVRAYRYQKVASGFKRFKPGTSPTPGTHRWKLHKRAFPSDTSLADYNRAWWNRYFAGMCTDLDPIKSPSESILDSLGLSNSDDDDDSVIPAKISSAWFDLPENADESDAPPKRSPKPPMPKHVEEAFRRLSREIVYQDENGNISTKDDVPEPAPEPETDVIQFPSWSHPSLLALKPIPDPGQSPDRAAAETISEPSPTPEEPEEPVESPAPSTPFENHEYTWSDEIESGTIPESPTPEDAEEPIESTDRPSPTSSPADLEPQSEVRSDPGFVATNEDLDTDPDPGHDPGQSPEAPESYAPKKSPVLSPAQLAALITPTSEADYIGSLPPDAPMPDPVVPETSIPLPIDPLTTRVVRLDTLIDLDELSRIQAIVSLWHARRTNPALAASRDLELRLMDETDWLVSKPGRIHLARYLGMNTLIVTNDPWAP